MINQIEFPTTTDVIYLYYFIPSTDLEPKTYRTLGKYGYPCILLSRESFKNGFTRFVISKMFVYTALRLSRISSLTCTLYTQYTQRFFTLILRPWTRLNFAIQGLTRKRSRVINVNQICMHVRVRHIIHNADKHTVKSSVRVVWLNGAQTVSLFSRRLYGNSAIIIAN